MGMDPVTMAAASAGANLLSSGLSARSARKDISKANRRSMAMANTNLANLLPAYQGAQDAILGGYGQAGQINQEALNRGMQMQGASFMPMMQALQGGNMGAQQANLASIPAMRAALLGGRIPQMQAQTLPIDQSALAGLINPQAMQFPGQQQFQPMRDFKR